MGFLNFLNNIKIKLSIIFNFIFKYIEAMHSDKSKLDNIESKLDTRAKSCLDWLEKNEMNDTHRKDIDTLFLSGYSMFKGSKTTERLTKMTLILSFILFMCTLATMGMAYFEMPEYPMKGQSVEPISSEVYIDMGNQLMHETEYSIKSSKIFPPSEIKIELLTDVLSYSQIYDTRGYEFYNYVNASNGSIYIRNDKKINPVLLHIIYTEKNLSPVEMQINIRLLPPNTNDSFYLLAHSGEYDIKNARINYDVINDTKSYFDTDKYDSWKNQTIIIYENSVPIDETIIDEDGKFTIEIKALNKWESKTYFIKKVGEDANE